MDWHARYVEQARWTEGLRKYLFEKAGLPLASRVLEVGCGTGALLEDIPNRQGLFGVDLDRYALCEASKHASAALLTCGDGEHLPYSHATFDLVYCHYLLLWVKNPAFVLAEMRRVVRPGGAVLALAEPDYGARIDHPAALTVLGDWQRQSLKAQGADSEMGRKLGGLFTVAGFHEVESGILGAQWQPQAAEESLEWQVLASDLAGRIPEQEVRRLREQDALARKRGERVLFVPTFYAWGRV